jgi:hypothetical protein
MALNIGDFVMKGIDDAATKDTTSLLSLPTTHASNAPTTTPVDTYYTGQLLGNSEWQLFTSKTERPFVPVSWASPMPEVEKCWSDIVTWRNSSISWWNKYVASTKFSRTVLTTQTIVWAVTETAIETTIYPTSVSAYTLCDGSPRVDLRPHTRTITSNVTKSQTLVVPKEFAFPEAQPCIPDPRTCRLWYYESNLNVTNEDELLQQCGRPTGLYEPCLVAGGPVQLIYWPEGNGESNICPNNASMSWHHPSHVRNTSTTALPDTITALGHTFISGSVYLSFRTLYASYDGFWDRVGPTFKDTIIPVPSSAMSTHCGGFTEAHGPGTALNYADLNRPVAASAYNCQARCDNWRFVSHDNRSASAPECQTIWNDINPNIAIPTLVRDLVPEWAHCEMSGFRIPNFWHDPPVALTMEASIAVPTLHAEPTQEPASPSSALVSTAPVETGLTTGSTTGKLETSTEAQSPKTSTGSGWTSKVDPSDDPQPPQTSTNVESTSPGQESGPFVTVIPIQDPTTSSAVATSLEVSNTIGPNTDVPDPTKAVKPPPLISSDVPLQPTADTTLFSYLPEPSPLNALSVLQSALSALSETVQPHATTTTATTHDGVGTSESVISYSDSSLPGATSYKPAKSTYAETSQTSPEAESTANSGAAVTASTTASEKPHATSIEDSAVSSLSTQDSGTATQTTDVSMKAPSTAESSTEVALPSVVVALPSVVQSYAPHLPTLVAGDLTVTASQLSGSTGVIVLGSHTFQPDDPVATISGHIISALSSGLVLMSSDSTFTFTEVLADSSRSLVPLVAGSLTVTAEVAEGPSGAISVGGTTLAKDGDYATLEDGQTLRFNPSGIEVVGSNSTVLMSSMAETTASSVTSSTSGSSPTTGYSTETSAPSESSGEKISSGLLGKLYVCAMMLSAAFVMC